ncbi:hypothetical protein AB832_08055 [Flavobacteriaceae bacterium (ex Bugula neritina AB1)]|nr:hypothetical protein AB832_08055 [Flavobacteriaceae bacterium (ex Bugula neritina AB1)]
MLVNCSTGIAEQTSTEYDDVILKSRGIAPSIANFFSKNPLFPPGQTIVELKVNGIDKGTVKALFDENGKLCINEAFLEAARLKAGQSPRPPSEEPLCIDYTASYPNTVIKLFPASSTVEMIVPTNALAPKAQEKRSYLSGGTAGMLNYRIARSHQIYDDRSSYYDQVNLDAGLNSGNWIVRSQNTYFNRNGDSNFNSLNSYIQRSFIDSELVVQAGAINILNSSLPGSPIWGVQVTDERALKQAASGVSISGVAQTSEATVEIRQLGVVIFTAQVPMGTFTFNRVPNISSTENMTVTILESDGSEHSFIVTPGEYNVGKQLSTQGFSAAFGRVRLVNGHYESPYLLTASNGWKVNRQLNMAGGFLVAQNYEALSGSLDAEIISNLGLSTYLNLSNDRNHQIHGASLSLSAFYLAPYSLNFSFNSTFRTRGYSSLTDSLVDFTSEAYSKNTMGGGFGWAHEILGRFSFSFSRTERFDSSQKFNRYQASWGKTFDRISLSVNTQILDKSNNRKNSINNNNTVYANINIPIGSSGTRISTFYRQNGDRKSLGAGANGRINPQWSYAASTSRYIDSNTNNFSANVSGNLHYTRLDLNTSQANNGDQYYLIGLSGGMAVHRHGLTFSPYAIDETFAIASLNQPIGNVKIRTNKGPVWTDAWGRAVIPSIPYFKRSNIDVDTETLPKYSDINNGYKTLHAYRGSFSNINFNILTTRRALLEVTTENGNPLPMNTAIFDRNNDYVTTSISNGMVYIDDIDATPDLWAYSEEKGTHCKLVYTLKPVQEKNSYYEKVNTVCKPGDIPEISEPEE